MTQNTQYFLQVRLTFLVDSEVFCRSDAKLSSSSSDQWSESIIAKWQPSKLKIGFSHYSPVQFVLKCSCNLRHNTIENRSFVKYERVKGEYKGDYRRKTDRES